MIEVGKNCADNYIVRLNLDTDTSWNFDKYRELFKIKTIDWKATMKNYTTALKNTCWHQHRNSNESDEIKR